MAMLGIPDTRIVNSVSGETFFIDEVRILGSIRNDDDIDFIDLEYYWKTELETKVRTILSPISSGPNTVTIYLMDVVMGKHSYSIQFTLEEVRFAKSNHKKCVALAVRKN